MKWRRDQAPPHRAIQKERKRERESERESEERKIIVSETREKERKISESNGQESKDISTRLPSEEGKTKGQLKRGVDQRTWTSDEEKHDDYPYGDNAPSLMVKEMMVVSTNVGGREYQRAARTEPNKE